jgi:hypothetical protein
MEVNFNYPLKQRIELIRSALMYGTLEEGIPMPTALTSTIRFEESEEGNTIWLMMKEPWNSIERKFPVTLQYYQKGIPHTVKVEGAAEVVYMPSNIAVIKVSVIRYEWNDLAAAPMGARAGNSWLTTVQHWLKEGVASMFRQEPAAA